MIDTAAIASNITNIESNLNRYGASISKNLVAISKKQDSSAILFCYQKGVPRFGENYVQELIGKHTELLKECPEIEWHFTGHLQSNKVKYIAPFIHTIQTVDSIKLAKEISKEAVKNHRNITIFIQVNTSKEYSKSGVSPEEVFTLLQEIVQLPNLTVDGLMTIPIALDDNEIELRKEFKSMVVLKDKINTDFEITLHHLSMGMTSDYEIALQESASLVRIGTGIFGER